MRKYIAAIMAIALLSVTIGTALDRVQIENKQITAEKRPLGTTTEEVYYGVRLSIPYNATENHTTNFSVTMVDLDHRPIAISGIIYWHNANTSSTKNDSAINNAWVKNAVIAKLIQYLQQTNVSNFNANKSIVENETRIALSRQGEYWGEFDVVIDDISLSNISFLMRDEYRCEWIYNTTSETDNRIEKDKAAALEKEEGSKGTAILIIGICIGLLASELRRRKPQ